MRQRYYKRVKFPHCACVIQICEFTHSFICDKIKLYFICNKIKLYFICDKIEVCARYIVKKFYSGLINGPEKDLFV